MQGTGIYIKQMDDDSRELEWDELVQLRKDILWMYDQNGSEICASYIPVDSFTLPYWEFVTLKGDNYFSDEERQFFIEGSLIIVLCMLSEYIDIPAGNQRVFGKTPISTIIQYINMYESLDEEQRALKEIIQKGLSIAEIITEEDIANNEEINHPEMKNFYSKLPSVSKAFVMEYYKSKLRQYA